MCFQTVINLQKLFPIYLLKNIHVQMGWCSSNSSFSRVSHDLELGSCGREWAGEYQWDGRAGEAEHNAGVDRSSLKRLQTPK